MRLLLLEDDRLLGEGLRDWLAADGYSVDWFRSLAEADCARGEPYDALLLDWQLPDGSGLAWLQAWRNAGGDAPALMLTARDRLDDRVRGLDSGADDYLVKPFHPQELAARLRAVLRRRAGASGRHLALGQLRIDLTGRSVELDRAPVDLTAREWAVLEALALRRGRLVAKADLERLVLGDQGEVNSNALEVHVSSLRRKLGRDRIETVRGMGYRLATSGPD